MQITEKGRYCAYCGIFLFLRLTVENLPLTSNLFTRFIVSNILNSVKKSKNENCCTEMDYQINQSVVSDRIIRQQYDRGEKRKRNIMKIKIEIDEGLPEDEVLIRCRGLTEQISDVQKAVSEVINTSQKFVFYRGNTEYYLTLDEILFFETDSDGINAHTRDNIYQTKYKLYELEELLPGSFMRISKSAIVNTNHIYSISRNLTASSVVAFADTHKQVYVSRYYYKPLINKLEEKRLHQ